MRIFLHIYFGFSQIMCESQEEQFSHVWEVGIDKGVQFGVEQPRFGYHEFVGFYAVNRFTSIQNNI